VLRFGNVVMLITADLVVEVMRCVESLLSYFSRAQDVEAKVCIICSTWTSLSRLVQDDFA